MCSERSTDDQSLDLKAGPLLARALKSRTSDPARTHKAQLIYEVSHLGEDDLASLVNAIQRQYVRSYRGAYNDMLRRAGSRQRLFFIPQSVRSTLARLAQTDAAKIRATYNRDLWREINRVLEDNPTFTRRQVISRLTGWNLRREEWKAPQIALWADRVAVKEAQSDFLQQNAAALQQVSARISPRTGVCEQCQRLIQMGEVSAEVARANPCPVHVNCVHQWVYRMQVVGRLPILANLGLRFNQAA